jgi:hypothetical protein
MVSTLIQSNPRERLIAFADITCPSFHARTSVPSSAIWLMMIRLIGTKLNALVNNQEKKSVTCSNSPKACPGRPRPTALASSAPHRTAVFRRVASAGRHRRRARTPPRDTSRVDTERESGAVHVHTTRLVTAGGCHRRTGHRGVLQLRVSGRGADVDARHSDAVTTEN